jgi:hypothetical protein
MKTYAFIPAVLFAIASLTAQTDTAKKGMPVPDGIAAPSSISNKFSTDYPEAAPAWVMDGPNYKAEYRDKKTNKGKAIVYDGNGNIIRNDNELDRSNYPAGVSDFYLTNYPNEEPQVWVTEDEMGNRLYYIKRKSEVIWLDKDGKYMGGKAEKKSVKPVRKKQQPKKTKK